MTEPHYLRSETPRASVGQAVCSSVNAFKAYEAKILTERATIRKNFAEFVQKARAMRERELARHGRFMAETTGQ